MKGWVGLVDLQRTVYPHKWSPVSCRSSAGPESSPAKYRRSTTVLRNQPRERDTLPARISDADRVSCHGNQVVVRTKQQASLAVEVFDGTELKIVQKIHRTVVIVTETCHDQVRNSNANITISITFTYVSIMLNTPSNIHSVPSNNEPTYHLCSRLSVDGLSRRSETVTSSVPSCDTPVYQLHHRTLTSPVQPCSRPLPARSCVTIMASESQKLHGVQVHKCTNNNKHNIGVYRRYAPAWATNRGACSIILPAYAYFRRVLWVCFRCV